MVNLVLLEVVNKQKPNGYCRTAIPTAQCNQTLNRTVEEKECLSGIKEKQGSASFQYVSSKNGVSLVKFMVAFLSFPCASFREQSVTDMYESYSKVSLTEV
jgi:hypothetical protein